MSDSKELNKIKKLYGEKFMHLCRSLFPTLLEQEGLLTKVLKSSFATNSRKLYEDITNSKLEENFKNYIYSKINVEKEKPEMVEEKTPYQLLDENGYDLYECNSEEDIQSFKKYYKPGEELCTFRGGRLERCVVFWAVKKNAEEIKRENFNNPKREDEYGTSVMGIQFTKSQNSTVSIKNRYNHKVNNPDATYGNDLDRIAPGLTQSFEKLLSERGLTLNRANIESFNIPGYVVAGDGKYYKYNMEINGIYYCPGNVIIDHGEVRQLEPEKQELIDYFILDKENKTLSLYDPSIEDSFIDSLKKIDSIEMVNDKESKTKKKIITIKEKNSNEPITIEIDSDNNIISYVNENLTKLENNFLRFNTQLSKFMVPNVTDIGDYVLENNKGLRKFEAPNAVKIGNNLLKNNSQLSEFIVPNVRDIGDYVLEDNEGLRKFEAPNTVKIGNNLLKNNSQLSEFIVPNVRDIGCNVLMNNEGLKKFEAPNAVKIGNDFLGSNFNLNEFIVPNARDIGDYVLKNNEGLRKFEAPNVVKIGNSFLMYNSQLSEFIVPNVRDIGCNVLMSNEGLKRFEAPNAEKIGFNFLGTNKQLSEFIAPNLTNESKEDLAHLFSVVEKNSEKEEAQNITSTDIAKLDKESQITTSELSSVKKFINKIKNLFKKKEEKQI